MVTLCAQLLMGATSLFGRLEKIFM